MFRLNRVPLANSQTKVLLLDVIKYACFVMGYVI